MTLRANQPKRGTPKSRSANPMNIKGDPGFQASSPIAHKTNKVNDARSDHTPKAKSANRLKRAGAEVSSNVPRGYVKNESAAPKSPVNVSARKNRKLKG